MNSRTPVHRLLIVFEADCGAEELCRGARERADVHTSIRFVAPVKVARSWSAEEINARRSARAKLDEALECLRQQGVTATAHLGSADPVAAIGDALADFPADEVLIFTGPDPESWWLHKEVVERAHVRFRLPTAQVVLKPRRELTVA